MRTESKVIKVEMKIKSTKTEINKYTLHIYTHRQSFNPSWYLTCTLVLYFKWSSISHQSVRIYNQGTENNWIRNKALPLPQTHHTWILHTILCAVHQIKKSELILALRDHRSTQNLHQLSSDFHSFYLHTMYIKTIKQATRVTQSDY